jgi:hypothetical protein
MITQVKLIGTSLVTSAEFKDANGVVIAPSTVTLKYKKPSGTITTTAITPVSGAYESTILLNEAGVWYVRWECSGSYASAEEFEVNVIASKVV